MRIKLTEEQYALINEYVNDSGNIQEQGGSEITVTLPRFNLDARISRESTPERGELVKFLKRLGTEPGEAINKVKSIIERCSDSGCPVDMNELVSSLVFLEILNTINNEYDSSAGGFIFEYFFSVLTGGEGVATKTVIPRTDNFLKLLNSTFKRDLEDISDTQVGGVGYSLKNKVSETSDGSTRNLIATLLTRDDLKYFFAFKTDEGVKFFSLPVGNLKDGLNNMDSTFMKDSTLRKGFFRSILKIRGEVNSIDNLFDDRKNVDKYKKRLSNLINPNSRFTVTTKGREPVAELELSKINDYKQIVGKRVQDTIGGMYEDLNSLSSSLNSMFTADDITGKNEEAENSMRHGKSIRSRVEKEIK